MGNLTNFKLAFLKASESYAYQLVTTLPLFPNSHASAVKFTTVNLITMSPARHLQENNDNILFVHFRSQVALERGWKLYARTILQDSNFWSLFFLQTLVIRWKSSTRHRRGAQLLSHVGTARMRWNFPNHVAQTACAARLTSLLCSRHQHANPAWISLSW